ncbi:cell elongation-specific peptidoglycan biosynthesis regulator RodA [Leucobacter luti]|uniref:FtsW/RodA/SpoVE family cell cycle protein n=1 Tax=Leucobacter luti TaxID=340320 RepID=UPI00104986B0|nr:FtsW/RodA/SpoVE family cell cycle protein [Leucobacter luti]MCW2289361.1 cell division protein FtsW (lipid II flippase) [Leucobacter luti]TCK39921.1 cell elongation-specific peptidoglycan biosynthesis regulator RodA [Leucobacter luti]
MSNASNGTSEPRTFEKTRTSETVLQRITALRAPRLLLGLELALLLLAIAVGVAAVVIIDLTIQGKVTATLLPTGALFIAALLALHFTIRKIAPDADPLIMPIAAFLNVLGVAMIYRIDLAKGLSGWGSDSIRQLVWSTVAVVAAIVVLALIRNHIVLFRYTYLTGLAAVVLLLLPMLPGIGKTLGGARVWIHIGSFSFQPGEIAKILLAIFFAGYLVRNRDSLAMVGKKLLGIRFPRGRDLGPLLVFWLAAMSVLVFQRDLGTSLLYFGLFLSMLYIATGRIGWIILGVGLFLVGGFVASQTLEYVNGRFVNWLDPFADPFNASLQMVRGLFGMANGGMTGTGLGQGYPEDTPLAQSDYIIPSLGEELGLIGLFVILAAYLLLVGRGLRIGFAGQDDFGKLLAAGLAFTIALQVFIVVGGVTRLIPLTGLTAPFMAAGGSSLVSNWIIIALLILLSNSVRNRPKLVIRA